MKRARPGGDRRAAVDPLPVLVAGAAAPIPVAVVGGAAPRGPAAPAVQSQAADPSIPARTTFQEDLTTAGQRQINLIWERTQAVIALVVVISTMLAAIVSMWSAQVIPNLLAVAFGTVVGFYFSRTNHAAIGGVGKKESLGEYRGR